MLQDKRNELDAEKRRQLLDRLVTELGRTDPDLYYRTTSEIALALKRRIDAGEGLNGPERELLDGLSVEDIKFILSLH